MTTVEKLQRDVTRLRKELRQLRRIQSVTVPVTTLDPEPYELLCELEVVIQPDENCFVATFFDANINASGDTQQDAVANVKDVMVALYERLREEPKRNLGKGPARQLAILQKIVRRKK